MGMKPCSKCAENSWDYLKMDNDPHIYCTCRSCGAKVQFVVPKKCCESCGTPTDFERVDISDIERGKKCLKCGHVKVMPIASASFVTEDGVSYRLEEDGLYHEVEIRYVWKKGEELMHIATNDKVLEII